jgi:ArsR family transcriptional regulator
MSAIRDVERDDYFDYSIIMEMTNALSALTALGNATRLAIFRRLVQAGPEGRVAGDLSNDLEVPPATLSFHLKELARADLVGAEQRGRFVCYRANFAAMNALIGYLTENCCEGEVCEVDSAISCPC